MPAPARLHSDVQLIVEGNDHRNFFEATLEHLSITGIQIQNFGGVNELGDFLALLVKLPDFRGMVKRLGIVRDAETSAGGAFQSVQRSLGDVGLPVPKEPAVLAAPGHKKEPAVAVLVFPGGNRDGMLETLLCETFARTAVDRCIDSFFGCVEESANHIRRPHKARARAYLATTADPHVSVGVAGKRGHWDFDHDAFDGVRRFLTSLAQDRPAAQQ